MTTEGELDRAKEYIARTPGEPSGGRNHKLNELGFNLLRAFPSLSQEEYKTLCATWAAKCSPPYPDQGDPFETDEFDKTIRSAWDGCHRQNAVGSNVLELVPVAKRDIGRLRIQNFVGSSELIGDKVHRSRVAVPISDIGKSLYDTTGGWPRRVGNLLFLDSLDSIRFLTKSSELLAWMHENGEISWGEGTGNNGVSLVTKDELYAHLKATTKCYESVESFPHEPKLPESYYCWKEPKDWKEDGRYLANLLHNFDNLDSPLDSVLLRAMFCAPAWGGRAGFRPAWAITAPEPQCGKSTIADVVGILYGSQIELEPSQLADPRLISRLLTPDALSKRIVRVDNIKDFRGSDLLESLVTSQHISGHRLYAGEASRPNYLTFILTANGIMLTPDFADRCFLIKLTKPTYRPEWKERVMAYAHQYRDYILMDIIRELKKPQYPGCKVNNYADFCMGVLSKLAPPEVVNATIELTTARRLECDEELDEAWAIKDAIKRQLKLQQGGTLMPGFISSMKMTEIVNEELNRRYSAATVTNRIKRHIAAERLTGIRQVRSTEFRGWEIEEDKF